MNIEDLTNKLYNRIKITYEEFIHLIKCGYELQLFYNNRKFGSTQFEGYEFYEWNKLKGYQTYKTIEEFSKNVNIDGKLLKDVWEGVKNLDFAD